MVRLLFVTLLLVSGCVFSNGQPEVEQKKPPVATVPLPSDEGKPSIDTSFITATKQVADSDNFSLVNSHDEEPLCNFTLVFSKGYLSAPAVNARLVLSQSLPPEDELQIDRRVVRSEVDALTDGFAVGISSALCNAPFIADLVIDGQLMFTAFIVTD